MRINEKTYLVLQENEKILFVEKETLSVEQIKQIGRYVPKYRNEAEVPYGLESDELEKTNEHIDEFVKQINELRYEK